MVGALDMEEKIFLAANKMKSLVLPFCVCLDPFRDYVRKWSSKGVYVVGWTVNTYAEKMYYENVLQTTYITDSLLEDCDPHY